MFKLYFFFNYIAVNGVVIACDKKVASVLVDSSDYQKIQSITPTTGTIIFIQYINNT